MRDTRAGSVCNVNVDSRRRNCRGIEACLVRRRRNIVRWLRRHCARHNHTVFDIVILGRVRRRLRAAHCNSSVHLDAYTVERVRA